MRNIYLNATFIFLILALSFGPLQSQVTVDTLAIQDFEISPAAPTWTYSGTPNAFNSGYSAATNSPANSPIGIGGSRAWWLVQVSSGNPVTFDNQTIPSGYDSVRVRFRLAAMNLNGSGNGPDNLDYVLLEYSTNGGSIFSSRIRVRGATTNNSWWPYAATGVAKAYYLPANELTFQPTSSGAQTTQGYSTVELVFPGSISQVSVRITPRSSAGGDHWLIDNLVLTGEKNCSNSTAIINASACDNYLSPSGQIWDSTGTYQDIIPNASNCDSIITVILNIANSTTSAISPSACNSYLSPGGQILDSSGTYQDTLTNAVGCDSIITINLTLNSDQADTISDTTCFSYTSPSGKIWVSSGTYADTLLTSSGCDSLLTFNLMLKQVDTSVATLVDTLTANQAGAAYQWLDCDQGYSAVSGATGQSFIPSADGNYAVAIHYDDCTDTSACRLVSLVSRPEASLNPQFRVWPNPVHDQLHLDFGKALPEGTVTVVSLQGKRILHQDLKQVKTMELHLGDLPNGMYLLQIQSRTQSSQTRFVKH